MLSRFNRKRNWILASLSLGLIGVAVMCRRFAMRSSPAVQIVSTDQLREVIGVTPDSDLSAARVRVPDDFVVVDVRAENETRVSMIPGAITEHEFESNRQSYRDRTVIAYCTVGYRSGKFAGRLRLAGFDARNYEASILGWAEAGLPFVTPSGKPTRRVHTYSNDFQVAAPYEGVVGD